MKMIKLSPIFLILAGCGGGTNDPATSSSSVSYSSSSSSNSGSTSVSSSASLSSSGSSSSSSNSSGGVITSSAGSSSSSSASSSSSSSGSMALGGIWTATNPTGTPVFPIQALTTESGEFFYTESVDESGAWMYTGSFTATGNIITGVQQQAFNDPGCMGIDVCGIGQSSSVTGVISQYNTLTINSYDWVYNDLYNNPSSLDLIAGNYTGLCATYECTGITNISSTGVITDQDPGLDCMITGQVNIIDSRYNAYDVNLTYSGADCQSLIEGIQAGGIMSLDNGVIEMALTFGTIGISVITLSPVSSQMNGN
jgi:hypothetical protein